MYINVTSNNPISYVTDDELARMHAADSKRHFAARKRGDGRTRYKKVNKLENFFRMITATNCLK